MLKKSKTLKYLNYKQILFISLIYLSIFNVNAQQSISTLEDSAVKKIYQSINDYKIDQAFVYYDDIFSTTFKENPKLLEKICLKAFESLLTGGNKKLKLDILSFISQFTNISLAKVIIKALKDKDPDVRDLAVKILVDFNNDIIYPDISSSLKSSDFNELISALDIVYQIKEKEFMSQVAPLLDHEDVFVKMKAIKTTSSLEPDDKTLEKLHQLLKSPSDRIRSSVIEGFCFVDEEKVDFSSVLKDGSDKVRIALLHWAKENPSKRGNDIIKQSLYSKNNKIFSAACEAALESDEMINKVRWERLIKSPKRSLRFMAVKALAKKNELLDDEDILRQVLDDDIKRIRSYVAKQIILSQDPFTEVLISDLLENGSDRVKKALVDGWVQESESKFPVKIITGLFESDNAYIKSACIPLLVKMETPLKEKILGYLQNSNKNNVRETLFHYISQQKDASLFKTIYLTFLDDPAASVQAAVLKGLFLIEKNLIKQVIDQKITSPFAIVRKESVLQSKNLDADSIWDIIEISQKDLSAIVRIAALKIAADLEPKAKVLKLYSELLFDDDEAVRSYALKELESPGGETMNKEPEQESVVHKKEKEIKKIDVPEKKRKKFKKKSKLMSWLKAGSAKKKDYSKEFDVKIDTIKVQESKSKSTQTAKGISTQLSKLLKSSSPNLSSKAEDLLLEMGDEKSLEKVKNRLTTGSEEERKKAAQKIGFLSDVNLIPVLREQLKNEKDFRVQFELIFAIWKMIPNLKK